MGKFSSVFAVIALALCVGVLPCVPAAAGEPGLDDQAGEREKKPRPTVDAAAVYYGDSKHFKKPAEVDPDLVYAEIEEYREILEKKLEPGDPKYAILLEKASRRFLKAVRKAARAGGHDLVARTGSVNGAENVPDVTQSVIDRL